MSGVRDHYNYLHPPCQGPWQMQNMVEYGKAYHESVIRLPDACMSLYSKIRNSVAFLCWRSEGMYGYSRNKSTLSHPSQQKRHIIGSINSRTVFI